MNEEQKLDIKTATKLKRRRYDSQSRFPIALVECWIIWMWHPPVLLCKNNNVKLQHLRFWRQCEPTTVIFYSLNLLQRLFLQFSCNVPHQLSHKWENVYFQVRFSPASSLSLLKLSMEQGSWKRLGSYVVSYFCPRLWVTCAYLTISLTQLR